MKIRTGVLLALVSVTLVFFLVVALVVPAFISGAAEEIERREAAGALSRVIRIMENELTRLDGTCEDWGKWDDTYFFVKGENEAYPEENLVPETFSSLQLDFMVFYDPAGRILYGKGYDHAQHVPLPVPEELERIPAFPGGDAGGTAGDLPPVSGVIRTPGAPLLASIGPILQNDRSGPVAGYLLVGRYLDEDEIERYSSISIASVSIREPREGDGKGVILSAVPSREIPARVSVSDSDWLSAEVTISDLSGMPAFVATIPIERTAARTARENTLLILVFVILASGAVTAAAILYLDRNVLSRISALEGSVKEIAGTADFSRRTAIPGDDEIASLSRSIDGMLDALERSAAAETAAKNEARLANTKISLLSSITRHDVLNQVMVIRGFADLLKDSIPADSPDRDFVERIGDASRRIEEQLGFMREYELEATPSSMGWRDIREIFLQAAMGRGLFGIRTDVLFEGVSVYSDRLIEKIFYALIDNSVVHGEKVTRITLSFHEEDDTGVLVYEDNGSGIPPGQKEMIFEHGVGRNHGLGLYLARGILQVHGISIRETGEYGRGARFEMRIPRQYYRKAGGAGGPGEPR